MAARQRTQIPSGTSAQRRCARDTRCSAKTRDQESGEWLPAPANQPLCPADRDVLITHLGEIPACYERLGRLSLEPVKAGRAVRVAPGSRVLANPEADALMREAAVILGGWAARVRAVPQLSLARHGHPPGSQEQVKADCKTLADFPDPLLALPPGPMTRTWNWRPGSAMPGDLEKVIADLEIVRAGDGWAVALTCLDGEDAALEILDLRSRAVRLLGETPAPPDLLDGIPCRACEAMSSLERVPVPPPDPEKPEPPYSRCTVPGCRDEMTRREYGAWVKQYEAWTRGAGVLTCRRCDLGAHEECQWRHCSCATGGHLAAA